MAKYSIVVKVADGISNQFSIAFEGGFMSRTDVTARVGDEKDGAGAPVYRNITWISDGVVKIDGEVPAKGTNVSFKRTTPIKVPVNDFVNGTVLTDTALDSGFDQCIKRLQEQADVEGSSEDVFTAKLAAEAAVKEAVETNKLAETKLFPVLTLDALKILPSSDRVANAAKIVTTPDGPKVMVYDPASTETVNGMNVIRPNGGGRWKAVGTRTRLLLLWGQSNAAQDDPRTVNRKDGTDVFTTTLAHDAYTTADKDNGTYDLTFTGKTVEGVFKWNNTTGTVGTVSTLDRNNVGVGAAVRIREETGDTVILVNVSQGSQPIERFLETSTMQITGISTSNPAKVTVNDLRLMPASVDLPVVLTGVVGPTALNGLKLKARAAAPGWSTWRKGGETPVAGTFDLYTAGGQPVNGAALPAYVSGGTVTAHHLLDELKLVAPAVLSAFGRTSFDYIQDFQGEANAGPTATDNFSTVGGTGTYKGYMAKRIYMMEQITRLGYAGPDTVHVTHEMNTDGLGKPRNDVITELTGMRPNWRTAPSKGYEFLDGSHVDDKWGLGYHVAGPMFVQQKNMFNPVPAQLKGLSDMVRSTGSFGSAYDVIDLTNKTLDLSGMEPHEYRKYLRGTVYSMRSGKLILPALQYAKGDLGLHFSVLPWSVSGSTPGEGNGNCVVEGAYDFNEGHSKPTVANKFTMVSADVDDWFHFAFLRNGNFYVNK